VIFLRPADQRHNARRPVLEARITYPFHPRCGERVAVVGRQRHAGAEHFVVRQPDTTLALLPAWMTMADTTLSATLVTHPRIAPDALVALRALVDSLLTSPGGDSSRREGVGHEKLSKPSTRSVPAGVKDEGVASVCSDEATPVTTRALDGGGGQGCGTQASGRGDRR
jgi:hypothetical protein